MRIRRLTGFSEIMVVVFPCIYYVPMFIQWNVGLHKKKLLTDMTVKFMIANNHSVSYVHRCALAHVGEDCRAGSGVIGALETVVLANISMFLSYM